MIPPCFYLFVMENFAGNLIAVITGNNPEDKLSILVTASGPLPEGFALKGFNGLDGFYYGQFTHAEIRKLAQHPNVKAVELVNQQAGFCRFDSSNPLIIKYNEFKNKIDRALGVITKCCKG